MNMKNYKSNLVAVIGGILFALCVALMFIGCTQNQMAKRFGGTTTIKIEKGQKLVEATWKENSLWYLTEPMEDDYVPKTKVFREDSNFGVLEGKVIFEESR